MCLLFCFFFCLFGFVYLSLFFRGFFVFILREREIMKLGGQRGREDLEGVEGKKEYA